MEIGEKIRLYRELRGLTQDQLGELSGIYSATIRKYELGIRNPKQDQLIKIANGLGINVSVFYDFDIETVGDVAALLFLLDEHSTVELTGERGENGTYRSGEVALRFDDFRLNRLLSEWADLKDIISKAKASAKEGDTIDGLPIEQWSEESTQLFKLRQMQNKILLSDKKGISIKMENKKKD